MYGLPAALLRHVAFPLRQLEIAVFERARVLKATGVASEVGMGAIRFRLGPTTTDWEIDAAIDQLAAALAPAA